MVFGTKIELFNPKEAVDTHEKNVMGRLAQAKELPEVGKKPGADDSPAPSEGA